MKNFQKEKSLLIEVDEGCFYSVVERMTPRLPPMDNLVAGGPKACSIRKPINEIMSLFVLQWSPENRF
jgi:hypothetical protein